MDGRLSMAETSSSHESSNCRTSINHSCETAASLRPAKATKLNWAALVEQLRTDRGTLAALTAHFDLLSVSSARFARARQVDPRFRAVVEQFGAQNCIRAVSVIVDCSELKKNQYKWMFEGLTLGAAIDSLLRESRYLFRSLLKQDGEMQHFLRLLNNWIDYLMQIHRPPRDAEGPLRHLIVERAGLLMNLTLV